MRLVVSGGNKWGGERQNFTGVLIRWNLLKLMEFLGVKEKLTSTGNSWMICKVRAMTLGPCKMFMQVLNWVGIVDRT